MMNQVVYFHLVYLIMKFLTVFCNGETNCCDVEKVADINEKNGRQERALLFPPSSTIGILAAISLPLNDRKNVFLSYNFEANYNSPYMGSDYIPGPLTRLDLVRSFDTKTTNRESQTEHPDNKQCDDQETITSHSSVTRRSLVTRTNLYKSIERKLNTAGYNGHDCLLRAICEAAEIPLGLHNGVLGDIMHIILTPSSSTNENILYDFYDAEAHGMLNMCHHYSKNCPESILDWISLLE